MKMIVRMSWVGDRELWKWKLVRGKRNATVAHGYRFYRRRGDCVRSARGFAKTLESGVAFVPVEVRR